MFEGTMEIFQKLQQNQIKNSILTGNQNRTKQTAPTKIMKKKKNTTM